MMGSFVKKVPSPLKVVALYFLLIAGGLWHLLGAFQTLMDHLAAPILIVLALALVIEFFLGTRDEVKGRSVVVLWCGTMLTVGVLIEMAGVKTGRIFGHYEYGHVLKPTIAGVPIAIGFAWLAIHLSSIGVAKTIANRLRLESLLLPLTTALLMVLFDVFMEPAAVYLDYWRWLDGSIPVQNYLAWFVISLGFSSISYALGIFRIQLSGFVLHAYFAQLSYFLIVFFKAL
jgi:putative membrane protein